MQTKAAGGSPLLTYLGLVAIRFINLPLTIAISIIIARVLSTSERGSYAVFMLFSVFWLPLLSFGQGAATLYVVGGRRYSTTQAAVSVSLVFLLIGLFVSGVIYGLWYCDLLGEAARGLPLYEFGLILAMLPLQSLQTGHTRLLLADSWFIRVVLFDLFQAFLFVLLLCFSFGWQFVHESSHSYDAFRIVIHSFVLTTIILTVVKTAVLLHSYSLEWKLNRGYLREARAYGWRIWGSDIMNRLSARGDQLILAYFVSASDLGLYAIALVMSELLNSIPENLEDMLFKQIVTEPNPEIRRNLIERIHRLMTWIMIPLTLLSGLILPPIALFLYGEKYLGAIVPFWLLLPGILFASLAKIMSKYFAGIGQPSLSSKMAFYGTVFGLTLSAILLTMFPEYGIKLAALANSLGFLLSFVLSQVFYRQLPGHEKPSLYLARRTDWSWLFSRFSGWRKR
jgi:O-antigen/teichoic acid export membrane protein